MKIKRIAIVLMMLVVTLMFGACGNSGSDKGDTGAVGTWNAKSIEAAGVTMDLDAYSKQAGIEFSMTVTFSEDKSFSMDAMGQKTSGTWEETDGKITATVDEQTQIFELKNGKLVYQDEAMGNVTITFEK